jgi:protein involved in polysaccharide export with SLBB domain
MAADTSGAGAGASMRLRVRGGVAQLMLFLSLLLGSGALSACNTTPDKRILQLLNQEGFGHPYAGNAELENYVTVGDKFQWVDELDTEQTRFGSAAIDVDGTVTIPNVGTFPVAGMTRSELESYMTQRFSAFYNETNIKVLQLDARARKVYYVVGEVPQPGERQFTGGLTVFDVVLKANPDPATANLSRVRLIRPDPVDAVIVEIDTRDIIRYGDTTYNIRIQERDILYIPPTIFGYVANFLVAVTAPFTKVIQSFSAALLGITRLNRFGPGGGGGGGNQGLF